MKKTKVFLGGYVNFTNAQNINCRSLAQHLDKRKYQVATMLSPYGELEVEPELDGVKFFRLCRPIRIFIYLTYLRALLWCDVAYLPKGEIVGFNSFLLKLFNKRAFNTVEGVIAGTNLEKIKAIFKTDDAIRNSYHFADRTYSITKFMADKNFEALSIRSDGVLYLGVESQSFAQQRILSPGLNHIAFIGNNMRYKGIDDIFALAQKYPDIKFHIVGGGIGYDAAKEIASRGLNGNVEYHGLLNHKQLSELLSKVDLHIFPSRAEGFPKVTLETAAAGVPSIVYGDYGASEWIESGRNGYVVDTFQEICDIVDDLQQHPEKLQALSAEAVEMAKRFDWAVLVKDWERAIDQLVM